MQNSTTALQGAGNEVVARTFIDAFRTELLAAGHELVADEPASVGGTGLGPSPYDLLSSALATCTSMTLKMYATRKELDVRSITVRVSHGKIHAKDCGDCETTAGRIDEFQRTIELDADLTETQTERMLQIADMCPVHRTLQGEIKVRTVLASP